MGVKANIKREQIDNLNNQCGIDVTEEFSKILQDQIQEEIDKNKISEMLFNEVHNIYESLKRDNKIDSLLDGSNIKNDEELIIQACKERMGQDYSINEDMVKRIYRNILNDF